MELPGLMCTDCEPLLLLTTLWNVLHIGRCGMRTLALGGVECAAHHAAERAVHRAGARSAEASTDTVRSGCKKRRCKERRDIGGSRMTDASVHRWAQALVDIEAHVWRTGRH
eukprot:1159010-Pelagomonas_calceolata.AAC.2